MTEQQQQNPQTDPQPQQPDPQPDQPDEQPAETAQQQRAHESSAVRPVGDPDPNEDIERTPTITPDGKPAVQTGTQSGPAAGPSPDAGGTTVE